MTFPTLAVMVLLPTLAALVVALIPKRRTELVYPLALTLSFLPLAMVGYVLWEFQVGISGYQFTQQVLWYEPLGISWNVGVDGISLLLLALTAILFPLSIAASKSVTRTRRCTWWRCCYWRPGCSGSLSRSTCCCSLCSSRSPWSRCTC